MNPWQHYRELLHQHRNQAAMGRAAYEHPLELPTSMILDLSPSGLAWVTRHKGLCSEVKTELCDGFDQTIALAAKKIQSASLKPGSGVVLNLWPPVIKVSAMMIGPGQRATTARVLDEIVQVSPDQLALDPALTYRVLDNGTKKVDLVGLGTQGFDLIQSALPRGVAIARMLGPVAALEVLLSKVQDRLPNPSLFAIVDNSRIYYFGVKKADKETSISLRVAARNTLRDPSDLKNTLNSMQIDPPSVFFAVLTTEASDVETICQMEAERRDIETLMTDRSGLITEYPQLAQTINAPLFPIALARSPGRPKSFEMNFPTRAESLVIPFTPEELLTLSVGKIFSRLSVALILLAVMACLGYSSWIVQTPVWKVDIAQVNKLERDFAEFLATRTLYSKMLDLLEATPRLDRLGSIICEPAPEGITLESVHFTSTPTTALSTGKSLSPTSSNSTAFHYSFDVSALSSNPDIVFIKKYVSTLSDKVAAEFPRHVAHSDVKTTSLDSHTGGAKFSFFVELKDK